MAGPEDFLTQRVMSLFVGTVCVSFNFISHDIKTPPPSTKTNLYPLEFLNSIEKQASVTIATSFAAQYSYCSVPKFC